MVISNDDLVSTSRKKLISGSQSGDTASMEICVPFKIRWCWVYYVINFQKTLEEIILEVILARRIRSDRGKERSNRKQENTGMTVG